MTKGKLTLVTLVTILAFAKGVNYAPGVVPLTDGPGIYPSGNTRSTSYDAIAPAVTLPVRVNVVGASTTKLLYPALTAAAANERDVQWGDCGYPHQYGELWANPSSSNWAHCDSTGFPDPQVAIIKLGNSTATTANQDAATIRQIVENAFNHWPTLKQVYLLDEGWLGYYAPEPASGYTHGVGIKQVISSYISAPTHFVAWGTYLWANGLGSDHAVLGIPGRSDGLEWTPADYQSDGLHQSTQGADKQAQLLVNSLAADPIASHWYDSH